MKKRNILNSPRLSELKRQKNRVLRNKILLYGFLISAFFTGLGFFARWDKINIQNVDVSGNKIVETEAIKESVKKTLSGSYLWLFPKTNFMIYPRGAVERDL